MDPILLANLTRGTLSLDDQDSLGVPLVWVSIWQGRAGEAFAVEMETARLVESLA